MNEKLRRSNDQMIAGVAAGVAEYLNLDPTLVRFLFVMLALCGGPGIVLYLVLWLIMPTADEKFEASSTG